MSRPLPTLRWWDHLLRLMMTTRWTQPPRRWALTGIAHSCNLSFVVFMCAHVCACVHTTLLNESGFVIKLEVKLRVLTFQFKE